MGDRLLSQHFPRRHRAPGSRLLDPQRHRLAQIQPDAEFPRPPLHQRARDPDLGGAAGSGARIIRSTTKRSRRATTISRCAPTGCFRCAPARNGSKAATARSCIRRKSRKRCWRASSWRRRGPTIWCSTRSAAPAPPARWRSACAGASSVSSARRNTPPRRKSASPRSSRCPSRRSRTFMTAREAPRVPFAALIERGLISPGIKLIDAKRRHRALVRADGACPRRSGRLDPPHRRAGAGPRSLQRLDLLAHRDAEGLDRDRHAARAGALGDVGSRRVSGAATPRVSLQQAVRARAWRTHPYSPAARRCRCAA